MEGVVPREIVTRPKKGFNAPVGYWINGSLKELVRDQLAEDKLKREGFFEPTYVQKLLARAYRGRSRPSEASMDTPGVRALAGEVPQAVTRLTPPNFQEFPLRKTI